jgi:hypothetical protein
LYRNGPSLVGPAEVPTSPRWCGPPAGPCGCGRLGQHRQHLVTKLTMSWSPMVSTAISNGAERPSRDAGAVVHRGPRPAQRGIVGVGLPQQSLQVGAVAPGTSVPSQAAKSPLTPRVRTLTSVVGRRSPGSPAVTCVYGVWLRRSMSSAGRCPSTSVGGRAENRTSRLKLLLLGSTLGLTS